MKTVGLIVEYNPLHNGHVYHYQQSIQTTQADASIAVMSGHFLQRGEPAIVNKWARTEMALHMGVDLVIELPVVFANQPAEWFAYGAVSTLHATGVVDQLCFGSESGDITWLKQLAKLLYEEPAPFQHALKIHLSAGHNFPAAYSLAIQDWIKGSNPKDLAQPNNTLGLHYLMALLRLNSSIEPVTIRRNKAGYSQTTIDDEQIASATALRKLLHEQDRLDSIRSYVPDYTYHILQHELQNGRGPVHWEKLFSLLLHQLLLQSPEQISQAIGVEEGLEHRFLSSLQAPENGGPFNFETFMEQLKTKRYTRTRLQRICINILLQLTKPSISKDTLQNGVPYIRVLGFSQKGRQLLKKMKTQAKVPVITKTADYHSNLFSYDIKASGLYALAYQDIHSKELLSDYYRKPIQL